MSTSIGVLLTSCSSVLLSHSFVSKYVQITLTQRHANPGFVNHENSFIMAPDQHSCAGGTLQDKKTIPPLNIKLFRWLMCRTSGAWSRSSERAGMSPGLPDPNPLLFPKHQQRKIYRAALQQLLKFLNFPLSLFPLHYVNTCIICFYQLC